MTYETIEVSPVLNAEQLKSLRFRLLTADHGRPIERSTLIRCEGKVKALLLRNALPDTHYRPALKAFSHMHLNPAKQSRRGAVIQRKNGGDLVLGWLRDSTCPDILRAGNRDNFFLCMRLMPLLRDMEFLLADHLPDYWKFHRQQAMRLIRPHKELRSLHLMKDPFQRRQLAKWNAGQDYYHFMGVSDFSTLTLNRNLIFGAHKDGNNVDGTLGCLTAVGDYKGGALCFPRLSVSFDLRPGDLLIADTNEEYHGTSSMIIGERYSVVAYLHSSLLPQKQKAA
jgi:hypothetical protein